MINSIFGNKQDVQTITQYKAINDFNPYFSSFDEDIYDSDIVRTCIHAIASNGAKLKAKHIRRVNNQIINANSNLEYLLQVRPNEHMNSFDFLYKVISQLYSNNNSFIYMHKDNSGNIVGLYPLNYSSIQVVEYGNEMYFKFLFRTGFQMTVAYSELLHLRRHFNRNDIFGEESKKPLITTLNLLQTINQGIINAIKYSAKLRGYLKINNNVNPKDIKKVKDDFVNDYFAINNNNGIGALDSKMDFVPANIDSKMADAEQMQYVRENIYRYFGLNENIITNKYNEDEWNAFYSSVIETIALQLSMEMTSKIFTDREKGFGNEIIFSASRLTYASNATKVAMAKELMPLGLFSINEMREILELEPVEGGDKRLQTLNLINTAIVDQYQLSKSKNDNTDKEVKDEKGNQDGGNQDSTT